MSLKTDKNYLSFLSATTVSALGSFAFNFAFMSYLYFTTNHDKRFVALSQLFFVLGMLGGNLSGGVWGDKKDKKIILLFCELIRIPIVATMLFFTETIWPLLFLHGLKTYFAGISTPLKRAYITATVEEQNVSSANMGFTISYSITLILGPFIGTWLYFYTKSLSLLIWLDILTFLISSFLILTLRKSPSQNIGKDFFKDLKESFVYIKSSLPHRGLFLKHLKVGVVSGLMILLVLPFTVEYLGGSEKLYGILMALFGLGGILGAILTKKINKHFNIGKIIYTISFTEPLIFLLWISSSHPILNSLIFFTWGALFFARATIQFNFISHHIDHTYNARVNALFDFVFTATNITAVTFISISGKFFDTKEFLLMVAIIYFIINLTTHYFASQKELRRA